MPPGEIVSTESPAPAPTVVYDTELSSGSASPLDPPDVESLLKAKRHHLPLEFHIPRRVQVPLTCLSIALSAVQANGVYCWPTYGPVVAKALGLTGTESQTIVVGGILGVYLCAAPLGSLTDHYGPRVGSLLSAFVSAIGYLSFAFVLKKEPLGWPYAHLVLTASYFAVGAAAVGSYFAALTTASLSFPKHPTLSLSLPLSLIGLSSLVLSSFSTLPTFVAPSGELNAAKFLAFLGVLSPSVNAFAAIFMRVIPPLPEDDVLPDEPDDEIPASPLSQLLHLDEHTPLLIGGMEAAREEAEAAEHGKDVRWTVLGLVRNRGFWYFGLLLTLCIGPAETVIASIGSILTSLLPPAPFDMLSAWTTALVAPNALALRNKHVFILSISSTVARLATGFTADYLAPPPIAIPAPHSDDPNAPTHVFIQRAKVRLRRSSFTAICAISLAAIFAWNAGWLDGEDGLWVLSGGVGALYGAIFTVTPAIVSTHFGPTNFGLAWGMVSYFPALGSVLFSYLYAYLSVAAATESAGSEVIDEPAAACYGSRCFSIMFWASSVCCIISGVGIALVGRKWKV